MKTNDQTTDPAAFAALHPALDGMTAPTETATAPKEAFTIDSADRANWLLRKLANIETEKARIKAQSAQMIAQLDADAERLNYRFGSELEAWTRQELERKGGKRKSITLLQGTVGYRTVPGRLTVADEEAAIVAARSYQSAATRSGYDILPQVLNRAEFVKFAQAEMERTGEMLPGIAQTETREAFAIKFPKAEASAED